MFLTTAVCDIKNSNERTFSLREKDRMRGSENQGVSLSNPLSPALSLDSGLYTRRERELTGQ
jgi:hypothetical protein